MTYEEIRHAWNAQADDEKQWNSLTEAEKVEWAARLGTVKSRGTAPIFSQDAQQTLQHLQRKGFNIVGYALEHCNDWTDNRRCTVDYTGLVRWIPSSDQEVAAERAARQKAQEEVVFLKERIARAGVEHRRAVREAVLEEREACAAACDALVDTKEAARIERRVNDVLQTGDEEDQLQAMRHQLTVSTFNVGIKNCAAAIRARQ